METDFSHRNCMTWFHLKIKFLNKTETQKIKFDKCTYHRGFLGSLYKCASLLCKYYEISCTGKYSHSTWKLSCYSFVCKDFLRYYKFLCNCRRIYYLRFSIAKLNIRVSGQMLT